MLLIHYVSVMMCIFYIDWQQYWICDWTMNIGAKHMANERYQLNCHNTIDDRLDSQASSDIGEAYIELVFNLIDCFTVRPFFGCYMYCYMYFVLWKVTRLITTMDKEFLCVCGSGKGVRVGGVVVVGVGGGWWWGWVGGFGWVVGHPASMYLGDVYWSLGCRGYFAVSNIDL